MIPPFEEALADLIDRYAESGLSGWRDEVIAALEMQLMAQREESASDPNPSMPYRPE